MFFVSIPEILHRDIQFGNGTGSEHPIGDYRLFAVVPFATPAAPERLPENGDSPRTEYRTDLKREDVRMDTRFIFKSHRRSSSLGVYYELDVRVDATCRGLDDYDRFISAIRRILLGTRSR